MIYFDNAATTKPCKEALAAFSKTAEENFANSASLHSFGIKSEEIITAARKAILVKFGKGNLIFTSGATESNNTAIFSAYKTSRKNHIVTTLMEHPSVLNAVRELEKSGARVTYLSYSKNFFEDIVAAVSDETALLAVNAVNNETGFITDTAALYGKVKSKSPHCHVHVDGVQAFLKTELKGDTISISAHKIHGIKGVGGLYINENVRLKNYFYGGNHQGGLRSGTECTELISSFGAAVENYRYDASYFEELYNYFCEHLGKISSALNIEIKINSFNNVKNIINFSVIGQKSEVILHFLAEGGIYVSSGSACARGKSSSVLEAFGYDKKIADSAIRVSLSNENTKDEIDKFAERLETILRRLSRIKASTR